jgi:hypothetical protein
MQASPPDFQQASDINMRGVSNHGFFFFNQLIAFYLIIDDKAKARKTVNKFFTGVRSMLMASK